MENDLVEVLITWDGGDPSVGIWAGFGEETGAYINKGPFSICIIWDTKEMDANAPVKDWPITEIQTNYIFRDENDKVVRWHAMGLVNDPQVPVYHPTDKYKTGERSMVLGDFPEVAEAVQKTWAEWQAEEKRIQDEENAYYEQLGKEADEFGDY